MSKKIVSVGLCIDHPNVTNVNFNGFGTLADGDIVLYQPILPDGWGHDLILSIIQHWQNELIEAYNEGKTIFVYMPKPYQRYWINNQENRDLFYHLPVQFGSPNPKGIMQIKLAQNADFLKEYWKFMEGISTGYFTFEKLGNGSKKILITYTGDRAVGVLSQDEDEKLGNVLFLPPFRNQDGKIGNENENLNQAFCDAIIRIDQNLKKTIKQKEEILPEWVDEIKLPKESEFDQKLEEIDQSIQKLQDQEKEISNNKKDYVKIKGLLYAEGKDLEKLIRDVLSKLGFSNVRSFREGELEIDVIFEYDKKVFIGEVGSKERSAIDKDKANQLIANFARYNEIREDCVLERAFLFGNGYRLIHPNGRKLGFTEGAIKTAKTLNCVLIETRSLYQIVQKLQEGANEEYCQKIRDQIINAESGVLEFES